MGETRAETDAMRVRVRADAGGAGERGERAETGGGEVVGGGVVQRCARTSDDETTKTRSMGAVTTRNARAVCVVWCDD